MLIVADIMLLLTDIAMVIYISKQDKKAQAERRFKN